MLIKYKKCRNCETYYDPTLEKCPHCYKRNELYLDNELSNHVAFMHPIAQIGLFLGGFGFAGMLFIRLILSIFTDHIADVAVRSATLISLAYVFMLIGLAAIVLFTRRKYFFSRYKRGIDYFYGLIYAITLVLVGSLIGVIVSIFYKVEDNANQSAAVEYANNYPILAFFILGIIGPICEELTYRVGLYSFLRRINKYLAIFVSAIIFAIIHFGFDAEDIVGELVALPSYIASGIVLAIAYENRGPACSMTAHIIYNIFAFLLMLGR